MLTETRFVGFRCGHTFTRTAPTRRSIIKHHVQGLQHWLKQTIVGG